MATKNIILTNIEISHRMGARVGLGGETPDGTRYHVWFDPATRNVGEVLYKNCPLHLKDGQPGFYWARKLRVTSRGSQAIIEQLLHAVDRHDLLAKFEQAEREREAQEQAERERAFAEERMRQAGPELLAALHRIISIKGSTGGPQVVLDEIRFIASEAINKVEEVRS